MGKTRARPWRAGGQTQKVWKLRNTYPPTVVATLTAARQGV